MTADELAESVLALPETERLDLARRIVESVGAERQLSSRIAEGVHRIEQVFSGEVRGLTEEEFRKAIE